MIGEKKKQLAAAPQTLSYNTIFQSTQQHSVPDSQGSKAAVETSNKTQQQQQFVQPFMYGQGFSQQLFLKSALQF